jgi:hypothetical protein
LVRFYKVELVVSLVQWISKFGWNSFYQNIVSAWVRWTCATSIWCWDLKAYGVFVIQCVCRYWEKVFGYTYGEELTCLVSIVRWLMDIDRLDAVCNGSNTFISQVLRVFISSELCVFVTLLHFVTIKGIFNFRISNIVGSSSE